MRFLGLEQPVEWQAQDVFNPAMAQMVLNAQKDYANAMYADYQQGLQEMKEFKKEFGDFLTPILADQDWYNQNVTGRVRDFLNNAYAQGIDLLRSPQGRAAISNLINTIDYGAVAKLRSSAENAKEYLKNRAKLIADGDYDPDFERFRLKGRSIEDWDTIGGNEIWGETSPSKFKDVNKWSSHLFDNMELSYDPEETKKHPGFLAYTKSRDTMNKIVDDNIAALLNTDQGKYFLQQAYDSIPSDFQGDRKDEALKRLKERVVNSNWERNQVKLESDPYAVARYSASLKGNNGGGRRTTDRIAYDSAEGLFYRGFAISGGATNLSDPEYAVDYARNNIVNRQIALLKQARAQRMDVDQTEKYIIDNLSIEERPSNFARYTGVNTEKDGSFIIGGRGAEDPNLFFDGGSIVSHAYGIEYGTPNGPLIKKDTRLSRMTSKPQYVNTNRSGLSGKTAVPTRRVVTAFTRKANGQYAARQFWEMEVGHIDDKTQNFVTEKYMYYEMPTSRDETHNMPGYTTFKQLNDADKNVVIIPSLKENPTTTGLKNSGSQQVNTFEKTPSPMGFWGTANETAIEEQ